MEIIKRQENPNFQHYYNFKNTRDFHFPTTMLTIQKPIEITAELLFLNRDPDQIEHGIEVVKHSFVYPRLNSWLCFFNEHYSKSLLLYSKTILALLEAAKEGRLLQEQTRNEFEISIEFYKTIFARLPDLQISTQEEAKLLLNISLIYGKYPGMVIRPLRNSLQILAHGVESLHELFTALRFVSALNFILASDCLKTFTFKP